MTDSPPEITALRTEILRYSKLNGYLATRFEEVQRSCGSQVFHLFSDDDEQGAFVECARCETEIDLCDSRQFIESAEQHECTCEHDQFRIIVARADYPDTTDPRWTYIGAHCSRCDIHGVYVDWAER